jgi:hypothetical protein
MTKQGDIRWVCAGIGLDEREALAKMETDSNLKLVFAAGKQGEYMANVEVVMSDREGKRPACWCSGSPGRSSRSENERDATSGCGSGSSP